MTKLPAVEAVTCFSLPSSTGVLHYIKNVEGCLERVTALADKVTLYGDPGTPEENADLAKLRRQINRMMKELLAAARERAELERPSGESWEYVN